MTIISTLRPGLLVSLNTRVTGNVSYVKRDIDAETVTETGAKKARWETERTIIDPAEHEAASKARGRVRTLIASVCANSAFGLLCPEDGADDLDKAIAEARKVAEDFNAGAKLTRLTLYVIAGRIAPDDVEAVRAINSEVRTLLDDMAEGVKELDVAKVREAATRAKSIGSMLSADAAARIQIAIDAARATAKKIVAAGEQAAQEVDRRTLATLREARTAFLDLDGGAEIAAPQASGRALDLAPAEAVIPAQAAAGRPALEV